MRFGSVCSGIEAASVAWEPLGWQAAWFAEIEPFPSAVLAHHYPNTPNLGDMTDIPALLALGEVEAPDILCGGTPCQAFSVAGLRRSLDDARGNLSLTFCEIANAIDDQRRAAGAEPCIVFWENVPGVLSTKDNAFGCFVAGLAGEDVPLEPPGGKWTDAGVVLGPARAVAWRVLDAQYFGLAQRRRRVFVVASAREGFDSAAVLFEWEGVRRDSAPSREAGQDAAKCLTTGTGSRFDWETEDILPVTHSLRGEGFDASEDGTGRGTPLVPAAFPANLSGTQHAASKNLAPAMGAKNPTAVAFLAGVDYENNGHTPEEPTGPLLKGSPTGGGRPLPAIALTTMQVRRLTPVECERLQGFPDNYTAIPWRKKPASECPDGPRYKALGNSWAVPVVRWIGARIECLANIV